ncbi:ABC transporter permease [Natrinema sp. SYSU A 869]|uniref:ABC transporter permease n=1 Tax=Natrinema sp. SYSU A 869 TaxID=2871694 RepID=UPI001CA41158|nr:ABC transporter permease [Natrinema sp. SYSU A 869]
MRENAIDVRRSEIALPFVALLVGVSLWWLGTALLAIPSFLLPSPGAVLAQLFGNPMLYFRNVVATLEKVVYGGAIGIAIGFGLGILLGMVPVLRTALYPYLVTVRVLPKIAVAPLLLIYLGTGLMTAIVFIALITFFPLVLNTVAGLSRTPERHVELLRSVDASRVDTFVHLRLPYAVPDVFAGLKQSVTLAVVGTIVAEWVVASSGLGYLILLGSENLRTDIIIAALVVLVFIGVALYGLVGICQRMVQRRVPLS